MRNEHKQLQHYTRRERMRNTAISQGMVFSRFRQLRRSVVFCLILLFSLCSATDSFQQIDCSSRKEPRAPPSSLQTATVSTGISLSPEILVYGGAAVAADSVQRRRWRIFDRELERSAVRQQRQRRRRSRVALDDEEYQRRKQEWADRYTTLEGLRATFGSNKNKLYGDLDAVTTRRLYKSLLPTAVCELVLDLEVKPEELAQLAFEARKAAKLYARERCHVPARLFANWYDGFRALRRYGRFQTEGMSYDQIFEKYYQRSALERSLSLNTTVEKDSFLSKRKKKQEDEWTEDDMVTATCMKILESACRTNPLIDRMTLSTNDGVSEREDLEKIAQTLEDDVRKLLDPYNN